MNFEDWDVFRGIRDKFLDTVEMAFIFGNVFESALLFTNDDRVFGLGNPTRGRLGIQYPNALISYIGLPTEITGLSKKRVRGIVCGGDGNEKVFLVAYLDSGDIYWWGQVPCWEPTIKSPQQVQSSSKILAKVVACGELHCVILSEDGQVFTCGRNDLGQLGRCFTVYCDENGRAIVGSCELFRVNGILASHTVIDVSCGYDFSAALLDDGRVLTWGCNNRGQLGMNASGSYSTDLLEVSALRVYYETFIVKIACGRYHVLALSKTGTLYAWGCNEYFQLGKKRVPFHKRGCPLEIRVNKLRFTDIAAHYLCNLSVAQCENGKLYHWGETREGGPISEPTEIINCDSMDEVFVCVANPPVMRKPMRRVQSEMEFDEVETIQPSATVEPLEQEFNNPETSDLKIVVDDQEICVHQSTLKQKSEYFNVMISRWLEKDESQSKLCTITLKEKSFAAVEAYLKYIYTDKLEIDLDLAVELLQLADEYGDDRFKSLCEKVIRQNMTADKVADIFAFTRKLEKSETLNEFCLNFALLHCTEVIRSPGYQSWDMETMVAFMEEYVKIKGNCR